MGKLTRSDALFDLLLPGLRGEIFKMQDHYGIEFIDQDFDDSDAWLKDWVKRHPDDYKAMFHGAVRQHVEKMALIRSY